METLEFIIHPDGRVEEKVTGIQGMSCSEVTRQIEEKLGLVMAQERTSEYYAQVMTQAESTISTQAIQSSW